VQQFVFEPPDDVVRGFQQAVGFGFQRENDVAAFANGKVVEELRHDGELPHAHRHPLVFDLFPPPSSFLLPPFFLLPPPLIAERHRRDIAGRPIGQEGGEKLGETACVGESLGG